MKPSPSLKNRPDHMTPEAEPIWDMVCKKYADSIYESKALRSQWATAKNHFHRICELKGIKPYLIYRKASARIAALLRNA